MLQLLTDLLKFKFKNFKLQISINKSIFIILKLSQKFCTFFSVSIRMSGKNENFGDKKSKKVIFTKTKSNQDR